MIFYNGFNLLIDLLLAVIVGLITYRLAWWDGYIAGGVDSVGSDYDTEYHCPCHNDQEYYYE